MARREMPSGLITLYALCGDDDSPYTSSSLFKSGQDLREENKAPDRFFISPDAKDKITFTRGDNNEVTGLVVTVYGGMYFTAEKMS